MMTWLKTEVDDELNAKITAYQAENENVGNKVQAVRQLIERGLNDYKNSNTRQ